jgi:hypothetical protein
MNNYDVGLLLAILVQNVFKFDTNLISHKQVSEDLKKLTV